MRAKLISDSYIEDLEAEINDFIEDKKAIDIKYQYDDGYYTALIMYEDEI